MIKKGIIFFILSIFVFLISGCETCKGATQGFKKDWRVVNKIDDWIQRNLW